MGSGIEMDVMALQAALAFLGAVAGVRIADDILHWRKTRLVRAEERSRN